MVNVKILFQHIAYFDLIDTYDCIYSSHVWKTIKDQLSKIQMKVHECSNQEDVVNGMNA